MRTTPPQPRPSRRATLRLAGAGALGMLTPTVVACGPDSDRAEPDPLLAQADSATADAAMATAAIAALPERAAALKVIAAERTAHAAALHAEVTRAIGVYRDGATPAHDTPPTAATAPRPTPPTLEQLRTQLTEARRRAAQLAHTQNGYRAGLLGSISAACAAAVEVQLK